MALCEGAKRYHRQELLDIVEKRPISELVGKWLELYEKIHDLYTEKGQIIKENQDKISELEASLEVKSKANEAMGALLDAQRKEINKMMFEPARDVKINLNDIVKVKLTPYGAEIYYNHLVELNKKAGRTCIEPHLPKVDKDGYTKFALWDFMNMYGEYMYMACKNVIEPLDIILCD